MELIRGRYNIQARHHGCVLTIGNFDGVHLGHQALIAELKRWAAQRAVPSCVVTFEPHPYEFFGRDVKPRLTRMREKLEALAQFGVDRVVVLPFHQALANLPATEFVETVLVQQLGAKAILIGDDFRFGHRRAGDIALLRQLASPCGFEVADLPTLTHDGSRVSSTLVRQALDAGDLDLARTLLGRPYSMSGRVAHGDKRGRSIGFPTANIFLHRRAVPISGVYCVVMHGLPEGPVTGVANVGNRPTVDGTRSLLEVHLFDFQREIYGEHVVVEFAKKLRDEKKYDSFDLLKAQIQQDAEQALQFFN